MNKYTLNAIQGIVNKFDDFYLLFYNIKDWIVYPKTNDEDDISYMTIAYRDPTRNDEHYIN